MRDIITSIVSVLIAVLFTWSGSNLSPKILGFLPLQLIVISSFFIHGAVLIPSYFAKTEKFYDITGTLAYLIMTYIAFYSVKINENLTIQSKIVILLILIWALRLGIFLLIRVLQVGEDSRFEAAKNSFFKFMMFFSISALWVFLTTLNALTIILNNANITNYFYFILGISIWCIGFSFEVISDEQKRRFRKKTTNKGSFINTGLWSISRHPNYFGEIVIWVGIAIISIPTLSGWQFTSLISPIFVYLLLTQISGVKLLEEQAEQRWGLLPSYIDYKLKTPVLFPFLRQKKM